MMSTGECHSPQNKAENNHAQRRFQYKLNVIAAKLLQKSEMRKDIVIELSYKGFS